MIGSLTLIDVAVLVGLWFVTSMVANLLWTRFVILKYVGRAVMSWIDNLDQDPEGLKVFDRFIDRLVGMIYQKHFPAIMSQIVKYLFEFQIKTGNKIKVATDELDAEKKPVYKEIDEILTPIDLLSRQVGNYAIAKIKGQSGGVKTQLNRVLQESLAGEGGMPLSPTALKALSKGQLGPALTEALLPEIMKRLNKPGGNNSQGGGQW